MRENVSMAGERSGASEAAENSGTTGDGGAAVGGQRGHHASSPSVRPSLPPLPQRMRKLAVDERGYPIPYFVAWVNGKPDHRIADPRKLVLAHRFSLCHVCGDKLGAFKAFVVGPMCGINRISSDPPSHRECAEWAAVACPFLSRPNAKRRAALLPDGVEHAAGIAIQRNPGVTLVWVTKSYRVVRVEGGIGGLFQMGEPTSVAFYAEGREATIDEIEESITSGLPLLEAPAIAEGPRAVRALELATATFRKLLPAVAA